MILQFFTLQSPVVTICTASLRFNDSAFCPQRVFMCFVWIWEQTAIISLYGIDWFVFITETECVYCAVRSTFYVLPTQCIYVFCVDLRTNSDYFTVQHWLVGVYNWDGVCLLRGTDWVFIYNSTFCPHSVFMCFVWIWEQTKIISLYNINCLVFTTETGFDTQTDTDRRS